MKPGVLNNQVNAVAPGWVAQLCQRLGIPMVHVSTDYVFDGELPTGQEYHPHHPTNPVNAYGRAKAAGERAVIEAGGHVVRTAWVYSGRSILEKTLPPRCCALPSKAWIRK